MNSLFVLDLVGAPVIIAGIGIIAVAVFAAIIFVVILVARKIAKSGANNKDNKKQ